MNKSAVIEKLGRLLLALLIIALLAVTYFFWQPYDKCLFPFSADFDKTAVLDFITGIIYYLLCFSAVIFIVKRMFRIKFFDAKAGRNKTVKLYLCLFAMRLLFDIAENVFETAVSSKQAVVWGVHLFAESIFDILLVLVTVLFFSEKRFAKRTAKRKCFLILSFVLIVGAAGVLIFKYADCIEMMKEHVLIWEYDLYYCNLTRDIVVMFSALLAAYAVLPHRKCTGKSPAETFSVILIRAFSIVVVFALINFAKYLILPHSMIKRISGVDGVTTNIERAVSYKDAFAFDEWLSLS